MANEQSERDQGRAQVEATKRRRRGGGDMAASKRLFIPPEIEARLEAEGRTVRWVNDTDNRMHRFTVQDDYDKVEGVEPVPVGTNEAGQPIMAHLLSKPNEFIAEDRARAEEKRQAVEKALFHEPDAAEAAGRGKNPNPAGGAERYIAPESSFRRGNQVLDG